MDKLDRKIELLNRVFDEEKRRSDSLESAIQYFADGNIDKFNEILLSIDDSIIKNLLDEVQAIKFDESPEAEE